MPGGVQNVPLLFYLRRVIFLYLVIAEKPSVAHSIGEVLGATEKKSGYLAGTGCLVTWCIGHLVELAQPHVYDERYAKWKWDDLPILPEEWRYNISLHTRKQFDIIRKLMNEPQVDTIVCATDAGREGELFFGWCTDNAHAPSPSNACGFLPWRNQPFAPVLIICMMDASMNRCIRQRYAVSRLTGWWASTPRASSRCCTM